MKKDSPNSAAKITWWNATYCHDLYSDYISNTLDPFPYEFPTNDRWVCPDVQNITLNNDGFLLFNTASINFVMVVNDCKDATEIDANNNLKSYTDE